MAKQGRTEKGKFEKGNQIAKAGKLHPPKGAVGIVRKLTAKGCSEISIAKGLGIGRKTWERFRDQYPEINAAWHEGRGKMHDSLVSVLYDSATKKGNIVSAMFLLKCVFGYREGAEIGVENKVSITFEIPGALPPEQYEQALKKVVPKTKMKELTCDTERT